ncbi:hypothetical protein OROMI_003962 [Orobanche minor]
MAFLSVSISLPAPNWKTSLFVAPTSRSTSSTSFVASYPETLSLVPPLKCLQRNRVANSTRGRLGSCIVRMAPQEERMTRRSPSDFPYEWENRNPGRRPEIIPKFSPMKTPLPPPMPGDPPEEDEEYDDEDHEEEEEEEDGENPEYPDE